MKYAIPPADEAARTAAHERWAACAHPLGSLGLLETALEDIAALTGSADIALKPRTLIVFCADNGVVAQGVTQTGSAVTGVVARALAAGVSTANRMAAVADCRVLPVDMGMLDFRPSPGVPDRRVGNGTGDITLGPAMSRVQAERAVEIGIQLAAAEKDRGHAFWPPERWASAIRPPRRRWRRYCWGLSRRILWAGGPGFPTTVLPASAVRSKRRWN